MHPGLSAGHRSAAAAYSQHFPSQPQLRQRVCACSCWSGASQTGQGEPATCPTSQLVVVRGGIVRSMAHLLASVAHRSPIGRERRK